MDLSSYAQDLLPRDASRATLVARVHDPDQGGPCVAAVRGDVVVDLSAVAPTVSELLERDDAVDVVRTAPPARSWPLAEVLSATLGPDRVGPDRGRPHLLAPVDLQVLKAAGVTFVRSMVERVIEERAGGDAARAAEVRDQLAAVVGGTISSVRPGSPEALRAKEVLVREGLWSQYLEVGIGPDPEIFTKAPILSAVGTGAQIGVLASSSWNNPEPELVLAVTSRGTAVGATLGNDVNLRDVEGRSALLLTEAKDNNASCAVGPFLRLFDDGFGIDDARRLDVSLRVTGPEGYVLQGVSSVAEISRDLLELVAATRGRHHQYPDGFLLFTGTMFAPTDDRDGTGQGFTHRRGDVVSISSPPLGALVNVVTAAEDAPEWTFGVGDLMRNLAVRGLLPAPRPVAGPTAAPTEPAAPAAPAAAR